MILSCCCCGLYADCDGSAVDYVYVSALSNGGSVVVSGETVCISSVIAV
jgi:hypothetical protein